MNTQILSTIVRNSAKRTRGGRVPRTRVDGTSIASRTFSNNNNNGGGGGGGGGAGKIPSLSSIAERAKTETRPPETADLLRDDSETSARTARSTTTTPLESFANLDHDRARRTGFPEAIFAEGKTPSQIASILDDMASVVNRALRDATSNETDEPEQVGEAILATRVDQDLFEEVSKIPLKNGEIAYHETARIISMVPTAVSEMKSSPNSSDDVDADANDERTVVVACAGTTDLPVAEEAAVTLEAIGGVRVDRVYDVGVAGLHRIVNALPRLRHPNVECVIVCAGMDGALPSVVGGLVSVPVVAVPTSVGYGASFQGVSALLTMLNSCAPGVGVVNIDNGFGAAALAFKCLRRR